MGQFSWLYSDTGKQMINGRYKASYLLVPEPFVNVYGNYIFEDCYDGYGHFGSHDIYDLVALWNQDHIDLATFKPYSMREPKLENYGGLWDCDKARLKRQGYSDAEIQKKDMQIQRQYYEAACKRLQEEKQAIADFCNHVSDAIMKERYGKEYLRNIGILFACYDEDNLSLDYPIKITSGPMDYASAKPSLSDPHQGWY